jgi:hypothetical protein
MSVKEPASRSPSHSSFVWREKSLRDVTYEWGIEGVG